eukprot:8650330-Pyramimonas_sp.AAC.1
MVVLNFREDHLRVCFVRILESGRVVVALGDVASLLPLGTPRSLVQILWPPALPQVVRRPEILPPLCFQRPK